MSVLLDKIRKARESNVPVGKWTFTIRRPTDEEAMRFRGDETDLFAIVKGFTIGWDLTELDLIPGGSSIPVPFESDLFSEWVADHPTVWEPLGGAIIASYKVHADKRNESVKN